MQNIIQFIVEVIRSFVNTCMSSELLSWTIYLFVLGIIVTVFSNLWRK